MRSLELAGHCSAAETATLPNQADRRSGPSGKGRQERWWRFALAAGATSSVSFRDDPSNRAYDDQCHPKPSEPVTNEFNSLRGILVQPSGRCPEGFPSEWPRNPEEDKTRQEQGEAGAEDSSDTVVTRDCGRFRIVHGLFGVPLFFHRMIPSMSFLPPSVDPHEAAESLRSLTRGI
jgi:hypothetical protein